MYLPVNGKLRLVPRTVRSRADDTHPDGGTVIERWQQDPAGVTAWADAEEATLQKERGGGSTAPVAGKELADQLAAESAERQRAIDEAHAAEAAESAASSPPHPALSRGRRAPASAPEA